VRLLDQFAEVWCEDFEFMAGPGENPVPLCLVAQELRSGREVRLWQDELHEPPYPLGPEALHVAYYASAEIGCHLALGWPAPARVLDLYAEFRRHTNGLSTLAGWSLPGALAYFGLDGMAAGEKASMRALVLRGPPWSAEERAAILEYCGEDVDALVRLLGTLAAHLDLPRALLRGRYMTAAARIERVGVPIDVQTLGRLRVGWDAIKDRLISRIDADYDVFDGQTFKLARFEDWLIRANIPWPRLPSGRLDLCDRTFRDMAKTHPIVAPLRELRGSLSELRLNDLAVGSDGRNRTLLSAFRARTARNQPSNTKFIFGPSTWLRGLIKPPEGHSVAYVDWGQQEFGIAAALSGDRAMQAAYESGDPYLEFARQAAAVPSDATRETHGEVRDQFKACALGVQYGLEAGGLAQRIGQPIARARHLIEAHKNAFATFWRWSDAAVDRAMLTLSLDTVFGWTIHIRGEANPRSLRNFPAQANASEALRLACCLATERGVPVAAPVHDALLICAANETFEQQVKETRRAMAEASRTVLGGFELRTDVQVIRWPDRFMDEKRGRRMWDEIMMLLGEVEDVGSEVGRGVGREVGRGGRDGKSGRYVEEVSLDGRGGRGGRGGRPYIRKKESKNLRLSSMDIPYLPTLPPLGMIPPEHMVSRFFRYLNERQMIHLRRQRGEPPPWTSDPILQRNKFCSVDREDDRTTRWIREHWREPFADHPALWFALCMARLVNNPVALEALGYPTAWSAERTLATLEGLKARGVKIWTKSYRRCIPPRGRANGSREVYCVEILDGLYRHPPQLGGARSLPQAWEMLVPYDGIGAFIAYEITTDLRHTRYLRDAPDIMRWANAGPGAIQGLNRVWVRPVGAKPGARQTLAEMRYLLEISSKYLGDHMPAFELRTIEHGLCEFSKYERLLGGGHHTRFTPYRRRLLASRS
jgi:DNA polymerase I